MVVGVDSLTSCRPQPEKVSAETVHNLRPEVRDGMRDAKVSCARKSFDMNHVASGAEAQIIPN